MNEDDLLRRICYLEKWHRRIAFIVTIMAAAVVVTATVIWRAQHRDVLRAREFIMTDDGGNVLATLSHRNQQTCLDLKGREKRATAMLCVGDDYGADLFLANDNGSDRAFLSAGSKIREAGPGSLSPTLVISRSDGKNLISATVNTDVKVLIGHDNEKQSIILSSSPDARVLKILDRNAKVAWTTPTK